MNSQIMTITLAGLLILGGPGSAIAGPPPPGGPGFGPGGHPPPHHGPPGPRGPSPGEALAVGALGAIITGAIIESTRPKPPPPPPAHAPAYPATRAVAVQRELKSLGYYHGYIDGKVGPQTRRAIQLYQADYQLPITGRIDPALLSSLGLR